MLAWACTVHKAQGLSLEKAVICFDLLKQRSFNNGQMYVALSRVTSLDGLYLTLFDMGGGGAQCAPPPPILLSITFEITFRLCSYLVTFPNIYMGFEWRNNFAKLVHYDVIVTSFLTGGKFYFQFYSFSVPFKTSLVMKSHYDNDVEQ